MIYSLLNWGASYHYVACRDILAQRPTTKKWTKEMLAVGLFSRELNPGACTLWITPSQCRCHIPGIENESTWQNLGDVLCVRTERLPNLQQRHEQFGQGCSEAALVGTVLVGRVKVLEGIHARSTQTLYTASLRIYCCTHQWTSPNLDGCLFAQSVRLKGIGGMMMGSGLWPSRCIVAASRRNSFTTPRLNSSLVAFSCRTLIATRPPRHVPFNPPKWFTVNSLCPFSHVAILTFHTVPNAPEPIFSAKTSSLKSISRYPLPLPSVPVSSSLSLSESLLS